MEETKKNLDEMIVDKTVDFGLRLYYLADELYDPDINDVLKQASIAHTLMDIIKVYKLDAKNLGVYKETVKNVVRGMITSDYDTAYNNLALLNLDLENQSLGGKNGK